MNPGMRKHFLPLLLSLAACSSNTSVVPSDFYAPTLYTDQATLTISIPVEIDDKNGKKSFVRLFEAYGFSGNGPSIEQVVKRNVAELPGTFDSEGDAFVLRVASQPSFDEAVSKLKCVEDVACLAGWLKQSSSIIVKE